MDYKQEKMYVGSTKQLFRVDKIKLDEGKAKGVCMIEVKNRSGMSFSVNVDRGLDIPYLDFKGENIGFISPCDIVAPAYFDDKELGFLKSFTAGFLTTCGLKMAGAPCEYEGKKYGLHGNISHTPATEVSYEIIEHDNSATAKIKGSVYDAEIFGDKLKLNREITCNYKEKRFKIHDKVTNEGYKKTHHMIIYHMNIGYPILSPESEIYIPSSETIPRNDHAKLGLLECKKAQKPDANYEEMCYYHKLIADKDGFATVAIFNPELDMGVAIKFDTKTLDHFVQWKMMGAGDYVIGLEPANSTIDGISDAIQNGSMKYLEPQQTVEYEIEVQMIENKNEFLALKGGN